MCTPFYRECVGVRARMSATSDGVSASAKAHRLLLKQSKAHHEDLYILLKAAGAVAMPSKPKGSLVFTLARAMVGQQVAAKVAAVFWKRVLAAAGGSSDKALLALFTPKNEAKIRACGLSGMKVRFLVGLGEAHRSKFLSARKVLGLAHAERITYLTQLDGIGVWTADMVGIFYCRDGDIWPQGDLAVRKTFAKLVRVEERATSEVAEKFAPYRSFLARHMWNEKNNPMLT